MVRNALRELKKDCTGCSACYNACPTGAIVMRPDTEGFYKPEINEELCIHCQKCVTVCPQIHYERRNNITPSCYAIQTSDRILELSSSGGVFSVLAEYVFEKNGYVCGAAYDPGFRGVSMIMIHDKKEMNKLRGSKYVYAKPGNIYQQVQEKLEKKNYVLFSGTPCQVAALNNYLGKEYSTLITVDILCGGTPSEKVFQLYADELSENGTIKEINFRDKKYGWDYFGIECIYEDGHTHYRPIVDPFFKGYLKWLYVGNTCAECTFATLPKPGDFTMGDFWQISKYLPDLNTDKGVSCLLLNNEKAAKIYDEIKEKFVFISPVPLSFLKRHNRLQEIRPHHLARSRFFYLINKGMRFSKAVDYSVGWKFDIALTGCWTVENYGGELTYYALYKTLQKMGYEVLMVERRYPNALKRAPHPSLFYDNPYPFFDISRTYTDFNDQWELNNRIKCFICGSDQIWNYDLLPDESIRSYTMDYVSGWRKKIAYATSFGCNHIKGNDKQISELNELLKNLSAISVREKDGCKICEEIGLQAEWVIDPVFLCNTNVYKNLMDHARCKQYDRYLCSYFVNPNSDKYGIDLFAQKLKCSYVGTITADKVALQKLGMNEQTWPYPYLTHLKIEDWLYTLAHADYIVTDSFHAVCMAIIFKVPFVFIQGKKARMTVEFGFGRLASILGTLDLMHRVADTVEDALNNDLYLEPIDYDRVHIKLEQEKTRSMKWLKDAIESPIF